MNTFSASLYNSLPTINVANVVFANRDKVLRDLAELFKDHSQFGVCLVHRHCKLEAGERMVAEGNVSQPERVKDSECYPERWLATGEAYEFSREQTVSPSPELLDKFQHIVGNINVLGIFYIRDKGVDGVALERTEGRRNIVEIVPRNTPRRSLTTAWLFGSSTVNDVHTVLIHECSACTVARNTNSHIENVDKMDGLERRRDLGHEIPWLRDDGVGADVRIV
ncbi:hypothetical protein CVT26_002977 [Gymnopilus dilepis]|uniref:Uncharacterized protein n=1 Tax=Gymnopilus dilepis TaxID=231916 RepID=A0A409WSW4_9AGAR|nr:hypothetical protein CVT26_002977 [Gymnopilus dilepis]